MSDLNAKVVPSGTNFFLTWDKDSTADGYVVIAPNGNRVQVGKEANTGPSNPQGAVYLGNPGTKFEVSVGISKATDYDTVIYGDVQQPPPPQSSGIPAIGAATGYEILSHGDSFMQAEVNRWKSLHAGYLRTDSIPGNQAIFDKLIAMCRAAQIGVMPVEHGTTHPITDTSFVKAQAQKYKDDPAIVAVEICNEPDLNGWSTTQYASFAFAAAKAIHDIDPNRIIVVGALWTGNGGAQAYVPAMISAGVFTYAKVLSMHLYDPPNSRGSWSNWDRAVPWQGGAYNGRTARELLDAAGHQDVKIISTESGGPRAKYGEAGQAGIVHDALGYGLSGKIASCCIYNGNPEVTDFFIFGHQAETAFAQQATPAHARLAKIINFPSITDADSGIEKTPSQLRSAA